MKARNIFGFVAMIVVLALPAQAGELGPVQKYFSDIARRVKATNVASEKRMILSESFHSMASALDIVQRLPLVSKADRAGIERFKAALQEKQDELAGGNGYVRVSDEQLNSFSDYVVQDMEQAAEFVTISLITLLLILILIVLLVR